MGLQLDGAMRLPHGQWRGGEHSSCRIGTASAGAERLPI